MSESTRHSTFRHVENNKRRLNTEDDNNRLQLNVEIMILEESAVEFYGCR